jgi:hypothetical protein
MEIKPEELEQLKKRYSGGVYEGTINFTDDQETYMQVEFIYRKPTTADVEAHAKAAPRSPLVANINMLQSLIVYPKAAQVIEQIREYPVACGRFVEEAIFPFFGASVAVKSRKL